MPYGGHYSRPVTNRSCGGVTPGNVYGSFGATPETRKLLTSEITLRDFILCPGWRPWDKSPSERGINNEGVTILERRDANGNRTGIWDVYDRIGRKHYPNFPAWLTETQNMGTSRKIPRTAPFKYLTAQSRHFFLYPSLIVHPELLLKEDLHLKKCPKGVGYHDEPDLEHGMFESCLRLTWEAIPRQVKEKDAKDRLHRVELPYNRNGGAVQWRFDAAEPTTDFDELYEVEIPFMTPIEELEVIADPINHTDDDALRMLEASGTGLPYYLVTEK